MPEHTWNTRDLPVLQAVVDIYEDSGTYGRSPAGAPAADQVPKYSWIWRIAIDPSPTADATRLTEPLRTSPAANTPGRLVSGIIG